MSTLKTIEPNKPLPYSPHDQLPAPEPKDKEYPIGHFYENTAKYLIKDTVRIMDNGLHIDIDKVMELETTLSSQLAAVEEELASNPLIVKYLESRYKDQIKAYVADRKAKLRDPSHYLVPFKHNDMVHRSYFMEVYAKERNWGSPEDKLPTGVAKWPKNLVKKYAKTNKLVAMLLEGTIPDSTPAVREAMASLAKDKTDMYNQKYVEQVKNPEVPYPKFNPGSSTQKQELFDLLGIDSDAASKKTGLPQWDRTQIERVHKETKDPDVKHLTQCFIDYSFAAIIRNNFIEAFYNYTVDGRLYGQYKLIGAKSGRFTSSNPNMLNTPSTKSRFAKPVKRCFTAPKGKIILAADYSALEDRVVANLSKDDNKLGLFLEGLDGHSLSATYYYPGRVKEVIGNFTNNKEASRLLQFVVDDKEHPLNPIAKAIRQDSKPISFGLAYGAYPPKVAASVKIPLSEAEGIFNAYHNELFPGITKFREEYVLPTARAQGYIHLGLGFTIATDKPDRDIRTLNNACSQFWSILTALTINKMHQLIDEAGLAEDVKVVSTIYDSIYFEVTEDLAIIKWTNENLMKAMLVDFLDDQIVHNDAASDIGYDWADMTTIPHDATEADIAKVLDKLRG